MIDELFAINLPDGESWARVEEQYDGGFKVVVSSSGQLEYDSAWNLLTFEDAVRNIMNVVWEAHKPFAGYD